MGDVLGDNGAPLELARVARLTSWARILLALVVMVTLYLGLACIDLCELGMVLGDLAHEGSIAIKGDTDHNMAGRNTSSPPRPDTVIHAGADFVSFSSVQWRVGAGLAGPVAIKVVRLILQVMSTTQKDNSAYAVTMIWTASSTVAQAESRCFEGCPVASLKGVTAVATERRLWVLYFVFNF